jgi:orotate phosphoribosyltransferase
MQELTSIQIASLLLENKILELSPAVPFTFASGIKSPIYCDGRIIMSIPELRKIIAYSLAVKIKAAYPDVQVISGVATGSIAMSAWIAEILNLPLIYYRKPKGYGHNNTVEGQFSVGQKVVVIEDVVSTGGSCLTAVESIRAAGLDVLGVAFIYSHGMTKSIESFDNANCKFQSLCGLEDVLGSANASGILNTEQVETVKDWKIDPANWGAKNGF